MRIGDVGSISPSGELVAFALAIAVVMALSTYLISFQKEVENGISAEEIRSISLWRGLDPDRDGTILVENDGFVISPEQAPFPLSGRIGLTLSYRENEITSFFENGQIVKDIADFRISSEVHGFSVLVKRGDSTFPGIMSVFLWEVPN